MTSSQTGFEPHASLELHWQTALSVKARGKLIKVRESCNDNQNEVYKNSNDSEMTAELVNKIQLGVRNNCAWLLTTAVHSTTQIKTDLELSLKHKDPTHRVLLCSGGRDGVISLTPEQLPTAGRRLTLPLRWIQIRPSWIQGLSTNPKTRQPHSDLRRVATFHSVSPLYDCLFVFIISM